MDEKSRQDMAPRILLAAGVFYPDVGGPAIHVEKIADRFMREGYKVQVVCYGDDPTKKKFIYPVTRISREWTKPMQWLLYFSNIFRYAIDSDIIYAFDPTAAGAPAALASFIFRKPFLIRIGGDPIWEREAEAGRRVMPMDQYYREGLYRIDRPRLYKIIALILKQAKKVVVYNQNFKDFYMEYFEVPESKFVIIKNPAFKREDASPVLPETPTILFAGRFVSYKNLPRVIGAFSNIIKKVDARLCLIGKGPDKEELEDLVRTSSLGGRVTFIDSLPQDKLFQHIRESSICLGPALSEFNPNFILEALSFGKPVLLSRGHGLSVDLPEEFLFDPLNQKELEEKILYLLDKKNYKKTAREINSLPMNQSWEYVTDAHVRIMEKLV